MDKSLKLRRYSGLFIGIHDCIYIHLIISGIAEHEHSCNTSMVRRIYSAIWQIIHAFVNFSPYMIRDMN